MQTGFVELFVDLVGTDPLINGLVGGTIIATMNLFGASLVLVWRDPSERALDTALGFAAGVMLAAAFTSLIIPGIEEYSGGNPIPTLVGVALGALFLDRADGLVPHAHYLLTGSRRSDAANPSQDLSIDESKLTGVILFILAITLHNIPEAGRRRRLRRGRRRPAPDRGRALADARHRHPEHPRGAGRLRRSDQRWSGPSALRRLHRDSFRRRGNPARGARRCRRRDRRTAPAYAMGFAAGAMLFVISDEIIPETHQRGYERVATLGLMAGVIVMLYLDIALAA